MEEEVWSHDPGEVLIASDAEYTNIRILHEPANPAYWECIRKQTL